MNENVLADAIWLLDSFFNPYFAMQPALELITANTAFGSSTRFRAIAAVARLIYWIDAPLSQGNIGFLTSSLGSDDYRVRSEAAYICWALRTSQLTQSVKDQLSPALSTAWNRETVLLGKAYIARALDRYDGSSLYVELRAGYEATHLGNTVTGGGIVIRSACPRVSCRPS